MAILHCLNGECSALVAACWLIYARLFENGTEALDFVLGRRKVKSSVDLVRYAQYFAALMAAEGSIPNTRVLHLRRIVVKGLVGKGRFTGGHIGIELFERGRLVYKDSGPVFPQRTTGGEEVPHSAIIFDSPVLEEKSLRKEILLKLQTCDAVGHPREPLFHFNLHTGYMPNGVVRMTKSDLYWYTTSLMLGSDFCLELDFEYETGSADEDAITHYEPFLDRNLLKCLARLVVNHAVKANEVLLTALIGLGHGRIIGMNLSLLL